MESQDKSIAENEKKYKIFELKASGICSLVFASLFLIGYLCFVYDVVKYMPEAEEAKAEIIGKRSYVVYEVYDILYDVNSPKRTDLIYMGILNLKVGDEIQVLYTYVRNILGAKDTKIWFKLAGNYISLILWKHFGSLYCVIGYLGLVIYLFFESYYRLILKKKVIKFF